MSRLQVGKRKYEGKIFPSRNFGDMLVLEYFSYKKILIKFVETGYESIVVACDLEKGAVKDKLKPSVLGVGILGNASTMDSQGKTLHEYSLWLAMLKRCYSCDKGIKNLSYEGCSVSENFKRFDYFKEWCSRQIGFNNKDFHLDKDILVKGNRVYSESTCCFVPSEINLLLTKNEAKRGLLPIGVSYKKQIRKFGASCNINGVLNHIGYYEDPINAFNAYKSVKEANIKNIAEKWKDSISKDVYLALKSYEVCISD